MKQTHTTIAQQQTLQQKTLALWVAENQLQTMRSAQRWPELGRKSQAYEKGGFSFRVETVVSPTSHPTLRQIEVAVIDPLGDDVWLIEMTAFRGLH